MMFFLGHGYRVIAQVNSAILTGTGRLFECVLEVQPWVICADQYWSPTRLSI